MRPAGEICLARHGGIDRNARIFVAQLQLLIGVCVVGVVASWLLVPVAGLPGAAWSFGLAMAVQAIGSHALLRTKLRQMQVPETPA